MKINIRDDDTCYHTKAADLKCAYESFLGAIPITLAITPFVSTHSFVMETLDGDRKQQYKLLEELENNMPAENIADMNRLYPVGDNVDLVHFIKNLVRQNKLEITMHGYSHRFYPDGAEFSPCHANKYNIRDSKLYLERLFDTPVKFFVPPSNKVDYKALQMLKENRLDVLTSGVIDYDGLLQFIRLYMPLLLKHPGNLTRFLKGTLGLTRANFSGVDYIRSKTFTLTDTVDSFMRKIDSELSSSGFVSVATHYSTLRDDKDYQKRFFALLEKFQAMPSVGFTTVSDARMEGHV